MSKLMIVMASVAVLGLAAFALSPGNNFQEPPGPSSKPPVSRGPVSLSADKFPSLNDAVNEAIRASGGAVHIPCGVYTVNEIRITGGTRLHLVGDGIGCTILIPAARNQRVLSCDPTRGLAPVCDGVNIGGFTIRADPSGSSGEAVSLNGFRFSNFYDIEIQANGTGHFSTGFVFGGGNLCYGNVLRHPVVSGQVHPVDTFIRFNSLNNPNFSPNANKIEDIWAYGNTGISTVIDAQFSAATVISFGLIESNSGATAITLGTSTIVEHLWLEANGRNLAYFLAPGGGANGTKVRENYFSGGTEIIFPRFSRDNVVKDNYPEGCITRVEDHGTRNVVEGLSK